MPALAALLADAPLQVLGDNGPALGSILLDQFNDLGLDVCLCVWGGGGREKGKRRGGGEERVYSLG